MLQALLADEGHQVRAVYDGKAVLPVVRQFDPDAVLLDIKMPGLDGYEVARRIRSLSGYSRPLLIALSGHFRKASDRILAQVVGFDHHLAKPYDPIALLELLAS